MPSAPPEEPAHIYVLMGEEQSGPFTVEQIRDLWGQSTISSDAYYWHAGLKNWEHLVVLMAESGPAGHVEESSATAPTFVSEKNGNGSGYTAQAQYSSHQTKKDRRQKRKAVVAAFANKTNRSKPNKRDRANSSDGSGHSFGADGKCVKCGSTEGAVEHFGLSCRNPQRAVQRSSHLPYCSSCRCYVNPNVVSQNRAGPGAAFAVGDNYVFAQKSTSELIKVCPKCGERVFSQKDIEFDKQCGNDLAVFWLILIIGGGLLFFGLPMLIMALVDG